MHFYSSFRQYSLNPAIQNIQLLKGSCAEPIDENGHLLALLTRHVIEDDVHDLVHNRIR
jgi:hypothetical protein